VGPCVLGRDLPACTRSALERAKDKKRRVSRVLCGEPLQVPKDALRAKAGGPAKTIIDLKSYAGRVGSPGLPVPCPGRSGQGVQGRLAGQARASRTCRQPVLRTRQGEWLARSLELGMDLILLPCSSMLVAYQLSVAWEGAGISLGAPRG